MPSHRLPPCLAGAATSDVGQEEGHNADQEQPPDEVSLEELTRRAEIKFSGRTGAVVASGSVAATTAPTYGLVHDVATVIEALPPELFDRHAEHRPCGLLCQRGAMGMLIGDVLGLPLLPWVLAEPVGKAALKHRDAIVNEKKKAKKKAKRRSADTEAATAAVLRRQVTLPLPTAEEIKAAWRRISRAARSQESPPPLAPEPAAEPEPEPEPEPHVCSEACAGDEICPRARALLEAAMSSEAAVLIIAAFSVWALGGCDGAYSFFDEELQVAQVRYTHALRRFKQKYPEFCGWGERSAKLVMLWTVGCAAADHPIPVAEKVASRVGFDMPRAVAACKADREARE